jgi:hypothetical protein
MEDHIEHQEEVLKLLKDSLVTTKNRMKKKQINIIVKGNLKLGIGYFKGYKHTNIFPSSKKRKTIN